MELISVNNNKVEKLYRFIKNVWSGFSHDSVQISPFGDDSVPLKGTKGIKSRTTTDSVHVILGYINKNNIAKDGEKRLFSVKSDGSESVYVYLKNDGTFEIGCSDGFKISYNTENKKLSIDTNAGELELNGDLIIKGSIKADDEITAMAITEATKVTLSKHIHATNGTPPTPGN